MTDPTLDDIARLREDDNVLCSVVCPQCGEHWHSLECPVLRSAVLDLAERVLTGETRVEFGCLDPRDGTVWTEGWATEDAVRNHEEAWRENADDPPWPIVRRTVITGPWEPVEEESRG